MVVVVIAAILLAVAVPSFRTLIIKNNVESLQSGVARALNTARTEASSRNAVVVMCGRNDGATCGAGNFANGWIVFEEGNDDDPAAVGELIDVFDYQGQYTIRATGLDGAQTGRFAFNQQGFLVGAPGVFVVCEPDGDLNYARAYAVQRSGLAILLQDKDATAGPDEYQGLAITCS